MFSEKILNLITKTLLLSVIAVAPFLKTNSLYFPYVSGKVYVFRLLVSIAFFFWIWLMLRERNYRPNFRNILVISVVLFFLAQAFVSFFGVDPVLSFFSTIERADGVFQYGFWVLYSLMLISVFRKEQDWKLFFSVFIIVAVLVSIYAWVHFKEQIRLYSLFGNSSYLAAFLLFAIGFCAITIERKFFKTYFLNILTILATGFFAITLIFTQTRGAYAGLAGGIFLFCFLSALFLRGEEDKSSSSIELPQEVKAKKKAEPSSPTLRYARVKEKKKLALFCGIFLVVGLAAIIVLFSARETNFVQNTYILKRATSVAKLWEDDVVRERLLVWQIALKAFKEKPIFGWGPENFGAAANKYYDYRVGMGEPWFDRAHSQPIDTLATGGIVLFSFYLFWLAAVIYTIFKISREKKILSFVLISVFLSYFLQGIFLFDILPTFLGLFPFLGFLVFQYNSVKKEEPFDATQGKYFGGAQNKRQRGKDNFGNKTPLYILIPTACFVLFIIYATCLLPYRANAFALKFYAFTSHGNYNKETKSFLEQSYAIKSPYTFWEVRKRTAWQFVSVLEYDINDKTKPEDIKALKEIYDYITPEFERFVQNKPYDSQMYYVLGRVYRLAFQKLGENDLDKAEKVLRKGFNYSDTRVEYFNELAQVLILEGKIEEGENLVKEHIRRISSDSTFSYISLGHFYFVAKKYDLAWEQYEKVRELGYKFYEDVADYSRYMSTAEQLGEYQKIVDMAQAYLERWGPDGDNFFNLAVAYLNLGEKEKAKEFFLKAVELKKEYEQYRPFFAPE